MLVRNWRLGLAAASSLLIVALASSAEQSAGEREAIEARWVPAFSGFGGLLIEEADTRVATDERGRFEGTATTVFAALGLSTELSTPALPAVPGRPRLFAHADVSFSFDSRDNIVSEGDPGEISPPDIPIPNPPVPAFRGQGSRTGAEAQPVVLSAGLGLAYHVKAWDREFRLKPSVEWLWHETEVSGQAGVVEPLTPPPPDSTGAATCPCRTASARASETQGWHSLGLGLELELDTARAGPLLMTLYASGQAYHVLGDRDVEVRGRAPWDDASGTFEFRSAYRTEPWRYRAGVGLRFRWLPE